MPNTIEGEAWMALEYGDLIKEAFIDPIRTVVVVDDDFPTMDAMLDNEIGSAGRTWNPDALRKTSDIVRFCRQRPWLVDIHDGQMDMEEGESSTTHLNHSDLLILDYHLDPADPTDGTRAIELLRRLAINEHFNLVVVYTRGDDASGGDIGRVVNEISVGMSTYDQRFVMQEHALGAAQKLIEEWEDVDDTISEKLVQAIDERAYLRVRIIPDELNWNEIYQLPEFSEIKALIDVGPHSDRNKIRTILKWALHKRQESLMDKFAVQEYGQLSYHPNDEDINWIRTSRLFITVVSKSKDPSEIPGKLLDAIKAWEPQPHRLLMSKMRSALDESGVSAEDEVLRNRCLQAGWLEDLVAGEKEERLWKVGRTLNRHWERLGDSIRPRMEDFSAKLADHLSSMKEGEMLQRFSPFKENHNQRRDEVVIALNSYACSKPVDGTHLTTGHILKVADHEYWLCLTPACDLVPGQRTSGWHGRLQNNMPFTAVELHKPKRSKALEKATDGSYLFFDIEGEPAIFSFSPDSGSNESIPNPKIEQFFADNSGRFERDKPELSLKRIEADGDNLATRTNQATVIAQLRYEYALNLLQRLGATQTRVGLDFESYSPTPED